MQVHSNKIDDSVVVPLDLADEAVNDFTARLTELIGTSPKEIYLDCARLKWITSKHVNLIWQAHNQCRESGILARLVNTSEKLIRVLKILDIYDLLTCDPADATVKLNIHAVPDTSGSTNAWQIVFCPEAGDIKVALDRFQNYLATLKVSDLFTFEIETVFYEVATNVRLHSGIGEEERIIARCLPASDRLQLKFEYRGIHFDPTEHGREFQIEEAAQKGQKRGYGLLMINRMTDAIKYERADDGRNTLTLEKRWR